MNLLQLYQKCLKAEYVEVEKGASYALERWGGTLYILFEWSHGTADWLHNLDFPATTYDHMGVTWFCHRGFLSVWKAVKSYIYKGIKEVSVKKIIVVGYSHGAALAALCHEFVWYHRPDLRNRLEGYGFGAPRVYWGFWVRSALKARWENFFVVRNQNDIVTHAPPVLLGFRHVGTVITIGKKGTYGRFDAHRPENYLTELGKIYKL